MRADLIQVIIFPRDGEPVEFVAPHLNHEFIGFEGLHGDRAYLHPLFSDHHPMPEQIKGHIGPARIEVFSPDDQPIISGELVGHYVDWSAYWNWPDSVMLIIQKSR